jgi:NhaA family Na+:H+ antiporter
MLVSLAGFDLTSALTPSPLGIAAGLFPNKQIGIFSSTSAAVKLGLAEMPQGAGWQQVYGIAASAAWASP